MPRSRGLDAAILTVGSELLLGAGVDTNTALIGGRFADLGLKVDLATSVPDDAAAIAEAVKSSARHHDVVVITGGLGPTFDDLTREGTAQGLGLAIVRDHAWERTLRERYQALGRRLPDFARKQADKLAGALLVESEQGTAPGQILEHQDTVFVLLPGPPSELDAMLEVTVVPWLRTRFELSDRRRIRRLRIAGMYESEVMTAIDPVRCAHPEVHFMVLAYPEEVHVVLWATGTEAGMVPIDRVAAEAEELLGDAVFGKNEQTLEATVVGLLSSAAQTVATAESCTGGLVSKRLTDVPGSSAVFAGGVVAYTDEAKRDWLSVPGAMLEEYGAVSSAIAAEMATSVRLARRATYGLAITGIAGPSGGSDEKPVGLVHIALADENGVTSSRRVFAGDRAGVRLRASQAALDMLRRRVSDHISRKDGAR